ncbi:GNAT family N-acetyltransferase [Rhodoligotrophos defluvii]|uniref:GNAT family N-acetyltransferase n=1 Tax=Rhodoligotrophos defluvii TaxID=2561934 RepID=UPI0010CA1B26|nr:GNAT family protein [Rhodoligotrophos defluvii]
MSEARGRRKGGGAGRKADAITAASSDSAPAKATKRKSREGKAEPAKVGATSRAEAGQRAARPAANRRSAPAEPRREAAKAERHERPVGPRVDPLPPGRAPDGRILFGRTVTLEPIDAVRHGAALFEASHGGADPEGALWTYMGYGPWPGLAGFLGWLTGQMPSTDPRYYAIVPRKTRKAAGMASYLNIRPEAGVIEIGHIWLAPSLQKTREATEAIFLLMRHAFEDLGCRRLEWKCDALNAASRAAARRFGFTFEGVFRKHMIVKGRSRDTAWFSITDDEWPEIRNGFTRWLADDNFDGAGRQKQPLSRMMPRD